MPPNSRIPIKPFNILVKGSLKLPREKEETEALNDLPVCIALDSVPVLFPVMPEFCFFPGIVDTHMTTQQLCAGVSVRRDVSGVGAELG